MNFGVFAVFSVSIGELARLIHWIWCVNSSRETSRHTWGYICQWNTRSKTLL